MTKLTTDDVKKVAKLSKLNLTDSQVSKFKDQLSKIVEHVSELSEVDTTSVDPTSQTTGLTNMLRKDEITPFHLSSDDALSGAKRKHNNYFLADLLIHK